MEKPKQITQTYLDYHEMIKFIDDKYKIKVRDYANKFTKDGDTKNEYRDFWHWLIGWWDCDVRGKVEQLPLPPFPEGTRPVPGWVLEILGFIETEFLEFVETDFCGKERYINVYVDW